MRLTYIRSALSNNQYPLLVFIITMLVFFSLSALAVYKCTNAQGDVAYQDSECQEGAVEKKMHVAVPSASAESKPALGSDEQISDKAFVDEGNPIVIRAELSNVLATLSPIRMRLIEYYAYAGKWPNSLADIDLKASEMTSSHIDKITLSDIGGNKRGIKAYLNQSFGEDKRLILMPKSVMGGTSFEWQCFANFNKQSLSYGGQQLCESRELTD